VLRTRVPTQRIESGVTVTPPRHDGAMSQEVAIAACAARQHALVTVEQARMHGFTEEAIRHRVETGRWRRMRHAVYLVNGAPESWEQAALAAVLASGPEAVASHVTAGVIWGFPNVFHEVTFEVSTPRPRRVRQPGVRVHRTMKFLEIEHAVRRQIPVTSVARTLVDLSGVLSVQQLGIATDFARRELQFRLVDLQRCVAGLAPARGRKPTRIHGVLRARLDRHDESESGLEMRVLRAIVNAGLPEPVQQHRVRIGNGWRRIDLAYPEVELAIEVDGWAHHGPRSAFDADRARDNELEIIGWDRLRFTSAFTDKQIAETVAAKLAALGHKPCA
jgi:very-short-patch-repair endonuclease